MELGELLYAQLQQCEAAIPYGIGRALRELFPDMAVLESRCSEFNLQTFAAAGHCEVTRKPGVHCHVETEWNGPGLGISRSDWTAWSEVRWRSHTLQVVSATWKSFPDTNSWSWILAESDEIAAEFYQAVCEWCIEPRGEIVTFDGQEWSMNAQLFESIRQATFESLVLPGNVKQELLEDFQQFLKSPEVYARYKVPWKRGALFLGPPGNGKTHCVKALINALDLPCLYVQGLTSPYCSEGAGIRQVFRRARQTTPCLVVMEDLDSLVTEANRSFLLNEMDGFAENNGLIVLATTNHPERLDTSLLERPSRFDRKYHFELPDAAAREQYLARWNQEFESEHQLTPEALSEIAEQTEAFSYAYLKELVLASLMVLIASPRQPMREIMNYQVAALRNQMK